MSWAELLLCSLSSEHPGALGAQHSASNYLHQAQKLNATRILQCPGRAGGKLGLGAGEKGTGSAAPILGVLELRGAVHLPAQLRGVLPLLGGAGGRAEEAG